MEYVRNISPKKSCSTDASMKGCVVGEGIQDSEEPPVKRHLQEAGPGPGKN